MNDTQTSDHDLIIRLIERFNTISVRLDQMEQRLTGRIDEMITGFRRELIASTTATIDLLKADLRATQAALEDSRKLAQAAHDESAQLRREFDAYRNKMIGIGLVIGIFWPLVFGVIARFFMP